MPCKHKTTDELADQDYSTGAEQEMTDAKNPPMVATFLMPTIVELSKANLRLLWIKWLRTFTAVVSAP